MASTFCGISFAQNTTLPDPLIDEQKTQHAGERTIIIAGGCFWGVEAVYRHIKGVTKAVSGYCGGHPEKAHYDLVCMGSTGHAEAVEITYDPAQISVGKLLNVFFSVAHDPTTLNRQGPDAGTQYRSAVFFSTPEHEKIAKEYIAQLNQAKIFQNPIVTEVTLLEKFYPAEAYHQDYAQRNPDQPYIVAHDIPKVQNLKKKFPDLYIEQ